MANSENNSKNNVEDIDVENQGAKLCEVSGLGIDEDITIEELRAELDSYNNPDKEVAKASGDDVAADEDSIVDEVVAGLSEDEAAAALAQIEPAAGVDASSGNATGGVNSGYGLQSSFDAQGVIALADVGPIDPTALIYGVENNNDELFIIEEDKPPVINPPSIEANLGVDNALVKEDGTIDVPITAQLGAGAASGEFLTITVTGIDASWGSFSAPVGVYDAVSGTWSVTLAAGQNLDTIFTFTPNGDSDIDLTGLVATVVATDPATGLSASDSDDFNVIVDAVADVPDLDTDDVCGEEGTSIPLTITTSVNDIDGSEVIEVVKISNVPAGVTLSAGTYDAVNDVWLLDVSDLVGLSINVPDGVSSFTLNVESVAYEQNTNGQEVDLTDNRASAFEEITVKVKKDDVPDVEDDEVTVDETDLSPTTSVASTVIADFGSDNPGDISGNGTSFIGNITSGGVPVVVSFDAATNTYTGVAGTEGIFTLVIQSDGDYVFTLTGVIDHPDTADHNDSFPLEFGVTATDSEGDQSSAVITVNVLDDGPEISRKFSSVDETDLENGPIGYTKTLDFDFGEDGAGSIDPNGTFIAKYQVGGQNQTLTSGGMEVVVVATSDGYIGTAGGDTIFTLSIDPQSGEYTYAQFATIDHPDGTDPDDVIWLKFGVQITDGDGDTDSTFIGVDVHDDGVVAHDDCEKFNAEDGSFSGNVLDNDELSQDVENTVTQVKFGSQLIDVPATGSATIDGEFGELEIYADGSYEYTLNDDAFNGSTSTLSPLILTYGDVKIEVTAVETATGIDFTIKVLEGQADLNGFFLDLNGDGGSLFYAGSTANNMNGASDGFDFAEVLGSIGGSDADVTDITISLDGLTFSDLEDAKIGIRATSVGDNQEDSLKLVGDVETIITHDECVQDEFEYVLTDADGDSDSAILKIKAVAPEDTLIVGKNVDDDTDSNVEHLVNGDEGVIQGGAGNDILVGDAGGSFLEPQTQDYNFVFVLDVSGSMGPAGDDRYRTKLLVDAVQKLLNDFSGYTGGEIKIHITPFSTDVKQTATFTVTDVDGLADARDFLDDLTGNGMTNYEAPLAEAVEWFQSGEPLDGDAITTTYFITDGAPNRYLDDNGDVQKGSVSTVLGEISGSDGSDEVALLQALSDEVIAVGIDVSDRNLARIDAISSDGSAVNIFSENDLNVVFANTNPLDKLSDVGSDVIEGGKGADIIFGDVLFTDDLADLHGLTTENGAGWEVFERLENGESALSSAWLRSDSINYIRSNALELSEESENSEDDGRAGGGDVIDGGAGSDLIFGQEGNDIISGGLGNDVIYGGSGADIFLFDGIDQGVDTIKDFNASEGDKVDLSDVIVGYDALSDDIADFVIATESAGNTYVSVDQSGNGGAASLVELFVLEGVSGFDLDTSVIIDTTTV